MLVQFVCWRPFLHRETAIVASCFIPCQINPSKEVGSSLKGKNLLALGANSFLSEKPHLDWEMVSCGQDSFPLKVNPYTIIFSILYNLGKGVSWPNITGHYCSLFIKISKALVREYSEDDFFHFSSKT